VKAFEFGHNLILIPLLYGLKNHDIVGSALLGGRFFIVNLIEQGHLLIADIPMIF
jgi:hypothetical protein